MTKTQSPSTVITDVVTSWPGVTAGPGSRGEFAFKLGRREIGHLHGDRALHIGFPKAVWHELYEQGRIDYHPVFPGRPGYASRLIGGEADVQDAIALLRMNYDRAIERHGLPTDLPGLDASEPHRLPFAPSLDVRAFTLRRERGDIVIYSTPTAAGKASRHYLNHRHEAMFMSDSVEAPLFVHAADRDPVERVAHVRGAFSKRHVLDEDFEVIPTPGHTPGATAFLWDSGQHRMLFTGDTIYLDDGKWIAAVLQESDRDAYIASLEALQELDFDVLVPWAATAGQPYYALTNREDSHARISAIVERLRGGATA